MGVSAIVVTHNRLHLLKQCLDNLLNQNYSLDSIFVVNNNSNDGTREYLKKLKEPKICTININENVGGAGGFHIGTKAAYNKTSSDYFWLMDDDTMPTNSSLESLMKAADKLNDRFGFLCSNVRWWKDYHSVNLPEVSKNDWTELLPQSNIIKVDNATFVSFFIKRSIVKNLGLPISEMFIWGDDYEYSTRISQKFNSYFVSDSIIIHKSKNSNGNETIYNTNRIKNYNYMYRNNLFAIRKYYGSKKLIKRLLNDISVFIEALFVSKNKRIRRAFCVLSGIIKGLLFNPKIMYPKDKY